MTLEITVTLMVAVFMSMLSVIAQAVLSRKLRRHFDSARVDMDKRVNEQTNRVDGLVKQYRLTQREVKTFNDRTAALTTSVQDMREYVYGELLEKMDETLLSVDAILDNADEVEEYPFYVEDESEVDKQPTRVIYAQPKPQPKPQPKSQPQPKAQASGLALVDAAAKKSSSTNGNGTYSRYQELRNQGYSATEATAMMRGETNGNGKRGSKRG